LPALTLINTLGRGKKPPCVSRQSPANWPTGATMESCTIFLGKQDSTPASLVYSASPLVGMVNPEHLVWWKIS
jgi:hypothetical protein